jgi:hypothetical protein
MMQSVRTLRCTIVDYNRVFMTIAALLPCLTAGAHRDYIDVDVQRVGPRADITDLDNGEFGSAALSSRLSAFRRDSGRSA